jgi:PAS domain S-box-containing protein
MADPTFARTFASACGGLLICLGGGVLAGWWLDIEAWKRVLPGLGTMNPMTAFGFSLSGLGLWCSTSDSIRPSSRRFLHFARFTTFAILAIALLKALEHFSLLHYAVDRLLFTAKLAPDGAGWPGRMAPNTTAAFLLAGYALWLTHTSNPASHRWARYLACAIAAIALFALSGYALDLALLYSVGSDVPMAIHTSLGFLILAAGIVTARGDAVWTLWNSWPVDRKARVGFGLAMTFLSLISATSFLSAKRSWDAVRAVEQSQLSLPLLDGTETERLSALSWRAQRMSLISMVMTVLGGITALVGVATAAAIVQRDLLRRRDAEKILQQSANEIFDLYNRAPCGYHSLDGNGVIIQVNDTELTWLNYQRHELVGRPFTDILTIPSRNRFKHHFPAFKKHGAVIGLEFELTRKDGSIFPVLLSATAIRDPNGQYVASRSTLFDVTDQKQAETRIQELNRELSHRANLMEEANKELEAFSYSVSHDLRAPLRHINGFASLLRQHAADHLDPTGVRYVETIADAARRMGDLIDDLLVFSRMGRAELHQLPVDLNTLTRTTIADLESDTQGRQVIWNQHQLPVVHADPAMLRQALFNLLANAVKYTRPRNPAVIEIGCLDQPTETVIFVRDNGVGFDPLYAHKLFGVFQRLHLSEHFEGTGIGLANVRRIIHRHGGRTWAEGKTNQGACFYFSLPCAQTP